MKKYIEIPMEVLERLVDDKCVEGSLRRDRWTGKISFKAYNRQPRIREKDRLVKESLERIKVYGSFPKDLGTARVMGLLEDHTRDAKNALIDREIIDFV